jgi:hypothetical protein
MALYSVLVPELRNDPLGRGYSGMSDQQILNDLVANPYRSGIVTTYVNCRDMLSMLTWNEFSTVLTAYQTLASGDTLTAYIVDVLKQPGNKQGDGGGLNFGDSTIRSYFTAFPTYVSGLKVITQAQVPLVSGAITKILNSAYQTTTRAAELGLGSLELGNISSARTLY